MNAKRSTGPNTKDGKKISSRNAVTHGLTGQAVVLPYEDAALYDRLVQRFCRDYNPVGDRETELVQSLADTQWRLNRIPSLESGIYARAHAEFVAAQRASVKADRELWAHERPIRPTVSVEPTADGRTPNLTPIIHADAFIRYQKELKNLSLQEQRLARQFRRVSDELQALQAERRELEDSVQQTLAAPAVDTNVGPEPKIGFVFASAAQASSSFAPLPGHSALNCIHSPISGTPARPGQEFQSDSLRIGPR